MLAASHPFTTTGFGIEALKFHRGPAGKLTSDGTVIIYGLIGTVDVVTVSVGARLSRVVDCVWESVAPSLSVTLAVQVSVSPGSLPVTLARLIVHVVAKLAPAVVFSQVQV